MLRFLKNGTITETLPNIGAALIALAALIAGPVFVGPGGISFGRVVFLKNIFPRVTLAVPTDS